jgi:hypothetical protein
MHIAVYTRRAVPNPAAHAWQRAACERVAAELGYEVTRDHRTRAEPTRHWTHSRPTSTVVPSPSSSSRASTGSAGRSPTTSASPRRCGGAEVDVYAANLGTQPIGAPPSFTTQLLAVISAADEEDRYDLG